MNTPGNIYGADPIMKTGGITMNPTGANGTGGITAPTGGPGNYGYGTAGNTNPTGLPTPTMNPAGGTTGGLSNAGNNWQSFTNELGKIYGKGVGSELYGFLDSGGGYNSALTQQAVEAQAAEMNRQAMTGYGNLESGLGEAGISPNSSVAALEGSNYWSNVTTAENAMTAEEYFNMWNSSMNRETSILGDILPQAGRYQASKPTTMDYISEGLGIAGSLVGIGGMMGFGSLFGGGSGAASVAGGGDVSSTLGDVGITGP